MLILGVEELCSWLCFRLKMKDSLTVRYPTMSNWYIKFMGRVRYIGKDWHLKSSKHIGTLLSADFHYFLTRKIHNLISRNTWQSYLQPSNTHGNIQIDNKINKTPKHNPFYLTDNACTSLSKLISFQRKADQDDLRSQAKSLTEQLLRNNRVTDIEKCLKFHRNSKTITLSDKTHYPFGRVFEG